MVNEQTSETLHNGLWVARQLAGLIFQPLLCITGNGIRRWIKKVERNSKHP